MRHLLLRYEGIFYNPFNQRDEYRFLIKFDYKANFFPGVTSYITIDKTSHLFTHKLHDLLEVWIDQTTSEIKKICTREELDPNLYSASLEYELGDMGYWQGYRHETEEEKRKRLLNQDKCPICEIALIWINLALCCPNHGVQA